MRAFLRKHKKSAIVIGLVGAWWVSVPLCGGVAACFDIARGHYEIQTAGLPARWSGDYSRLLRERYGIKRVAIGGCSISWSAALYSSAYNAVATRAARRKFGRDVFAECARDARTAWEARRVADPEEE